MSELLDIVNEKDEVVGQVVRDDSNKGDYLFRMIFIGFYTPEKEIILQRRSMSKKLLPGKLTTTVSGHVESGWSYHDTAVKEAFEETGVAVDPEKLHHIGVFPADEMRAVYAYPYDGAVADLKIEEKDGDGFVAMSLTEFREAYAETPEMFTPFFRTVGATALLDYIEKI